MNSPTSDTLFTIGYDSIVYAGTKYVLHKIGSHEMLKNVNVSDIVLFAVIDGIHHVFFKTLVFFQLSSSDYSYLISKYAIIIAGVSVANFIMGRHRVLDNIISIGVSAPVGVLAGSIVNRMK